MPFSITFSDSRLIPAAPSIVMPFDLTTVPASVVFIENDSAFVLSVKIIEAVYPSISFPRAVFSISISLFTVIFLRNLTTLELATY